MRRGALLAVLAAVALAIAACIGANERDTPAASTLMSDNPTAFASTSEASMGCIPEGTKRESGKVVDVVDGDTIKVEIDGEAYRVRYIGIDTPETVKPNTPVEFFGPEASDQNEAYVGGKTVTLIKDASETDAYDRLLRYVVVDGIFVNFELVSNGYASAATYPPDVACSQVFRDAQRAAREAGRGLWASTTEK